MAVTVTRDKLHEVAHFLRHEPGMDFDYIVHVSSVDWPDDEERFEVVWAFYSIRKRHRIRLKTRVPESDCVVDSLTDLWKGADFMEREVYDMMGIRFRNDRGHVYCSPTCRRVGRHASVCAARRKHQQSPEGRLDHRDHQRAYRARQRRVMDQGSLSAATRRQTRS